MNNLLTNFFLCICCFLFGFTSTFGYDDLSFGKRASQSPLYHSISNYMYYAATNALDRNITSCMRTQHISPMTIQRTWWNVDLGKISRVYDIRILFKDYEGYALRQRGRFAGFSLYLSNSTNEDEGYMCYKDGPQLPPLNFTTTCIGYGRYVIYYNERLYNYTYPEGYQYLSYTELCEVIVRGCKRDGVYGEKCDKECSKDCQGRNCHIVTGKCEGCKPGWLGNYCRTPCDSGYYGEYCTIKCSSKCINNCNNIDGTCICSNGLRGSPNCTKECPSGFYGPNCGHVCSLHCQLNDTCESINGTCPRGCKESYEGPKCDIPNQTYRSSKENESSSTALLVTVVISGLFNVICLVAFAIFKRKQMVQSWKEKRNESQTYITRAEIHKYKSDDLHDYQDIGKPDNKSNYSNLQLKEL